MNPNPLTASVARMLTLEILKGQALALAEIVQAFNAKHGFPGQPAIGANRMAMVLDDLQDAGKAIEVSGKWSAV